MPLVLLAALLDLIALICVASFVWTFTRSIALQRRGVDVVGVVRQHVPDDNGVTLLVGYVVNGVEHRVESGMVVSPEEFPLQSTVPVRYLPDDPSRAVTGTGAARWSAPIALAIASIIMGGLGGGLTVALIWY